MYTIDVIRDVLVYIWFSSVIMFNPKVTLDGIVTRFILQYRY